MKKKNMILVGCLALLLVMTVGYALFSETITINGTATAKGNFDISYTCEIITEELSFKYQSGSSSQGIVFAGTKGGTGTCNINGQTITTTSNLTKPTDVVYYRVKLTNSGSIPAVLKTVNSPNNSADVDGAMYIDTSTYLYAQYAFVKEGSIFSDGRIDINGDSKVENENIILQPGEILNLIITHAWVDADEQPEIPAEGASINYNITLGFEQITVQ